MSVVEVSQLTIYPVKSAKGIGLKELQLGAVGPEYDRRWMVVDADGRFITQRQYPQMCLISTQLGDDLGLDGQSNDILTLSADSMEALTISPDEHRNAALREVVVWNDTVRAEDCGDQAADWLTRFLGTECRLVFMPDDSRRPVNKLYAHNDELVSFADGFPLLLISEASLQDLNTRLSSTVAMNRFRPNIVVSGCDAFAEDDWKKIRIGDIELSVAKACSRCVMPSINQETGKKHREINRVLASYRRRDGAIFFGQNLLFDRQGLVSLGDRVEILA